jgi:hypothetical protein
VIRSDPLFGNTPKISYLSMSDPSKLTAGLLNLHVGLRPYFLETRVGRGGFFLFTLTVEALRETEERPTLTDAYDGERPENAFGVAGVRHCLCQPGILDVAKLMKQAIECAGPA